MEVILLEALGVPSGCLLSLKAGTSRRQGVADPSKFKVTFPFKRRVDTEPMRLDILEPLGGAILNLQTAVEAYEVSMPSVVSGAPDIKLRLRISEIAELNGPPASSDATAVAGDKPEGVRLDAGPEKIESDEDAGKRRHRMALQARRYEGEFVNGKKHGEGQLTWPDGRSYTGQWANGQQHGEGLAITARGIARRSEWNHGSFVKWLEGPPEEGQRR